MKRMTTNVYGPTPGKKAEVLTWKRSQYHMGGHTAFEIPSNSVFYDVDGMHTDINYKRISHIENEQLTSMQNNGVK